MVIEVRPFFFWQRLPRAGNSTSGNAKAFTEERKNPDTEGHKDHKGFTTDCRPELRQNLLCDLCELLFQIFAAVAILFRQRLPGVRNSTSAKC